MDALDCSSGCNPNWTRARESSNRAWPEPDKRSVFYVQTSLEPHTVTVRERLHSGAAAETHSQLSFQRCVHFLVSLLKQTERQHSEDVQIQSSCPIGSRWVPLGPVGSPQVWVSKVESACHVYQMQKGLYSMTSLDFWWFPISTVGGSHVR